jgi:hypothetical protein
MKLSHRVWIGIVAFSSVVMAADRPALPYFPDVPGYKTLVCDLHTHTVFSDGLVWPTVRIEEAWREGLDAIALSDHIEYQPHQEDIPTRHERPYEIALPKAQEMNVLLIKGAEITKDTPPGHYNAVFIKEIDPIGQPDVLDAVRIAAEQKAFVFWNHHTWQGVDRGRWEEVQTTMYENKWLHGMEVANGSTYYPQAHQWCLDKNLTMIGSSDIHEPAVDVAYTPQQHRTVTLVLAKERSVEAIREAVFAGRTLVWCGNLLVGPQPLLEAMYEASVSVSKVYHTESSAVFFEVSNQSSLDLELERSGKVGPTRLKIPARSTIQVKTSLPQEDSPKTLSYTVKNMLIAPQKGLNVQFQLTLTENAD